MTTDDRLNELLDRWEELRQANPAITVAEACSDHPELVEPLTRRIEALRQMNAMLDMMEPAGEQLAALKEVDITSHRKWLSLRSFDGYELLEEISRGGMGVVYKARQRNPDRLVALKMIRPDRFDRPSDKVRFKIEAETAANLSHPNVIRIYEVGECSGLLYFTMMLFEHGSLAEQITKSAYSERDAASLVKTVALAIHAAHQSGILHRDLKPSNILLDSDGNPHVTDFGLAKRIGEDAGATHSGTILGTPCYMAPEQVASTSKSSTVATDVYGLGAILYELLTGHKPFEGVSVAEVLSHVLHKEPRRPRSINPGLSRDLESICLKCLEKVQSLRYRSAESLAEDIDLWLSHKPVGARSISLTERSWRWCRNNPLVASLAGAVGLLSFALIIGGLLSLSRIVAEQKMTAAALKSAESRALEAEVQRRVAIAGNHSVIQGITEPLKKLADPDLARDPSFSSLRHEIIGVANKILKEYVISIKDEAAMVDCQIHIGLLLTADGDHPSAREAYRNAIQAAELQVVRFPDRANAWDQLGQSYTHLGMEEWEQGLVAEATPNLRSASEAFGRATKLATDTQHFIFQHAAWFLIFCPAERFRDPERGLEFAERVARLVPNHERDNPTTLAGVRPLLTLGLAHYRKKEWASALVPVEKSIRLRSGGDAYEGFTLAMILARLGDHDNGLARYKEAELWMRRNRFGDFELHFLRDEAAEVLHVNPPAK